MSEQQQMSVEEADGKIDEFMRKIFGKSWRTTALGLLSIVFAVLPFIPGVPQDVKDAAHVLGPIILGGGLMTAKDARVTGLPPKRR